MAIDWRRLLPSPLLPFFRRTHLSLSHTMYNSTTFGNVQHISSTPSSRKRKKIMCGKAKAVQFVCFFSLAIPYSVRIRSRSLHNILKSFYGGRLVLPGREKCLQELLLVPNWAILRGGPSTRATRDSSNTFPYRET